MLGCLLGAKGYVIAAHNDLFTALSELLGNIVSSLGGIRFNRNKNNIRFVYTVAFSAEKQSVSAPILERLPEYKRPNASVVVVGSGPAGLFCALRLLARGIAPIVVERGAPVDERARAIDVFCNTVCLFLKYF